MKMERTECSETSAHKIQTPGNYPKERIQPPICFGLNKLTSERFQQIKNAIMASYIIDVTMYS